MNPFQKAAVYASAVVTLVLGKDALAQNAQAPAGGALQQNVTTQMSPRQGTLLAGVEYGLTQASNVVEEVKDQAAIPKAKRGGFGRFLKNVTGKASEIAGAAGDVVHKAGEVKDAVERKDVGTALKKTGQASERVKKGLQGVDNENVETATLNLYANRGQRDVDVAKGQINAWAGMQYMLKHEILPDNTLSELEAIHNGLLQSSAPKAVSEAIRRASKDVQKQLKEAMKQARKEREEGSKNNIISDDELFKGASNSSKRQGDLLNAVEGGVRVAQMKAMIETAAGVAASQGYRNMHVVEDRDGLHGLIVETGGGFVVVQPQNLTAVSSSPNTAARGVERAV